MHRIGLALSGGGFRATLFHLGMIRFLREANVLPSVTHITSVSGGSVLAAHLVLHWQRYTGSLEQFDAAAAELIRFVQLDVRNRVVRRYPLTMPLRALLWLTRRRPHRQLTRTGLLEYHYEKLLYGDTCLFQLPEQPRLYILATNLSEGCLCAFTRDGLLMQRRMPGQRFRFDRIHTGLATVPMAVTASSAFPGFFPPIELQGQDVGADPGEFGRLAFTDGGVYDNLGVRMFRCLERSWMAREVRLRREDLVNIEQAGLALQAAAQGSDDTPLRRLAQMMELPHNGAASRGSSGGEPADRLLDGLWDVMNHENLAREPVFARLSPPDPDALPLLHTAQRNGGDIEAGEQLWLNRKLIDAAFRQASGHPCFRSLNACFDTVLVSDAGKQFKISTSRAGGLITTGMRATDIVMDRVWQLETDTFAGTPGFVFAPISKVVSPEEDPTAMHPEMQRMATDIRTDLDRFSPLEISSLIQHGYCVGRSACRLRPDLFGTTIPTGVPWNPLSPAIQPSAAKEPLRPVSVTAVLKDTGPKSVPEPILETIEARKLQQSSRRRLWSTLWDYRDWASYVYVPLLIPLLFVLPYYGFKWYRQAQVAQRLIESMAQSNRDFDVMSKMLQGGPVEPFQGLEVDEVDAVKPLDYGGVEVIADTRVLDFRPWNFAATEFDRRSWVYVYRRLRIKKTSPATDDFIVRIRATASKGQLRPLGSPVPVMLRSGRDTVASGKATPVVDVVFDLTKVLVNDTVDLAFEYIGHEPPPELLQSVTVYVDAKTSLLTCWLLLPESKHFKSMDLLRVPAAKSAPVERIKPANELISSDGRTVAFTLLSVEPGVTYERRWTLHD